jgi:hypothetical protein
MIIRSYPLLCLKTLNKTTKTSVRLPGWESNLGPHEYDALGQSTESRVPVSWKKTTEWWAHVLQHVMCTRLATRDGHTTCNTWCAHVLKHVLGTRLETRVGHTYWNTCWAHVLQHVMSTRLATCLATRDGKTSCNACWAHVLKRDGYTFLRTWWAHILVCVQVYFLIISAA